MLLYKCIDIDNLFGSLNIYFQGRVEEGNYNPSLFSITHTLIQLKLSKYNFMRWIYFHFNTAFSEDTRGYKSTGATHYRNNNGLWKCISCVLSILQPGRTGIKTLQIFGFVCSLEHIMLKNKIQGNDFIFFNYHFIFTTIEQYKEIQSWKDFFQQIFCYQLI